MTMGPESTRPVEPLEPVLPLLEDALLELELLDEDDDALEPLVPVVLDDEALLLEELDALPELDELRVPLELLALDDEEDALETLDDVVPLEVEPLVTVAVEHAASARQPMPTSVRMPTSNRKLRATFAGYQTARARARPRPAAAPAARAPGTRLGRARSSGGPQPVGQSNRQPERRRPCSGGSSPSAC